MYQQAFSSYKGNDLEAAARMLEQVIAAKHDHGEAHFLLGEIHRRQGRLDDAVDHYVLSICHDPGLAYAHCQLGVVLLAQGQHREALAELEQAANLRPDDSAICNTYGAALVKMNKLEEAVAVFRRATETSPGNADAHSNLGYLLVHNFEEFDKGAAHIRTALEIDPDHRGALCNQTIALYYQGRFRDALEFSDSLLARGIADDELRLTRAMILLMLGDFENGWPEYEMRKHVRSRYQPRGLPYREWTGAALEQGTLLIHAEQGLGDQIMFASCVPDAAGLAGRCILECDPRLLPMFARSFPGVDCYEQKFHGEGAWSQKGMRPDAQVSIGSLPRFFRRNAQRFPARSRYLLADEVRVQRWRDRLAQLPGRIKVGLSWRGGIKSSRSGVRSIPLERWLPILRVSGVDFVSLQYGDCRDEIAAVEHGSGSRIHHWQAAVDDYEETAALVDALDLVISVQTALVHLAGALGKPVRALIAALPECCYLAEGETVPWYPSVRLVRQNVLYDWDPVILRVREELVQYAISHQKD
ncbi:MAG: tetratricopeptide repeat protein [Burkholderiales bacterium]|nr:tetratricopeptide repeat protein [Burkholderiales bacterium]